ncbi:hypothetical protein NHJ6243_008726, partial [Beauveria neobassiana]
MAKGRPLSSLVQPCDPANRVLRPVLSVKIPAISHYQFKGYYSVLKNRQLTSALADCFVNTALALVMKADIHSHVRALLCFTVYHGVLHNVVVVILEGRADGDTAL